MAANLHPDLKLQVELHARHYADYPGREFRPGAVLQPSGFDNATNDIPYGLEPLRATATVDVRGAEVLLQKHLSRRFVFRRSQVVTHLDVQNATARKSISQIAWDARLRAPKPDESIDICRASALTGRFRRLLPKLAPHNGLRDEQEFRSGTHPLPQGVRTPR